MGWKRLASVVGVLATFTGCGGGGGGGTSTGAPASPGGPAPTRFAYVANVADDTVSVLALDPATGSLRHASYVHVGAGARPRDVVLHPTEPFAYVVNQAAGTLSSYAVEPASGALTPVGAPVDAGSDSMAAAVDPSGRFLYAVNLQNQILGFRVGASGALEALGAPLPTGPSPASVAVHPSGRFVYTANAGGNTLSAFSVDPSTGALASGGTFDTPSGNVQAVAIEPGGRFAVVTNGGAQSVTFFGVDQTSGALTEITTAIGPSLTTGVAIHPSGRFVYVANPTTHAVAAFEVDLAAGTASAIDADPAAPGVQGFPAGTAPDDLVVDPTGRALYVTDPGDRSLAAYAVDPDSGALASLGTVRGRPAPASIALASGPNAPSRVFAYTANFDASTISAYEVDTGTGALRRIDADAGTPALDDIPTGSGPRQVATRQPGDLLYAVNGDAMTLSTYRIEGTTGSLAPVGSPLQLARHPESITFDRSGRFAYVLDIDGVSIFGVDPTSGSLTAAGAQVAGSNPRASVIDPTGQFLYVANASSNTISTYRIDPAAGSLARVDADPGTPGIQDAPTGLLPIALAAHPSGRFLHVVNRNEGGGGKLGTYAIDAQTGALAPGPPADAGFGPWALTADPSGRLLFAANRESGDVWSYAADPETGALTPVATAPAGTHPEAVAVDPSGRFVYTANFTSSDLSAHAVDPATGRLDAVAGGPFPAGAGATAVAFAVAIH